jgi:SAM-dependent methyltransferase
MIDWDREWRAARARSPLRMTVDNKDRWRDFWSGDARYYLQNVRAEAPLYAMAVQRLSEEGWVREDDDVLDVGSGPGTFALPLAPHVRSVTALDEAEGMLETLRQECAARGIGNVATVLRRWEDHPRQEGHDLVLASMNPAIASLDDLLAMERSARSRCCYVTACPSDQMALRNELWSKVVGKFEPSDHGSVRYPLNILASAGRRPRLYRVRAEVEVAMPAEEVVEHFVRYFSIFTDVTPRKEGAIREHVLARSRGGIHSHRGSRCLHLLCWSKGRQADRARRH